jgi:hypothetical protein
LILFKKGWTKGRFGDLQETEAFDKIKSIYPAIAHFLEPFTKKGRKRYDKGDYWWELRACDYYDEFENEKIIWPGISSQITAFAYDNQTNYGNDNAHFIITNEKFLLGVLNSKLVRFYLQQICDFVRGGYARLKVSYISEIPIVSPKIETKEDIKNLVDLLRQKKAYEKENNTTDLEAQIDLLVYQLYGLTYQEVLLVDPEFELEEEAYTPLMKKQASNG